MTGYLTVRPDSAARLRLFCFHHGGGSASAFADWQAALGPEVCVLPVQLTGREKRAAEPRIRDMATLVTELDTHLGPWLRQPYVFYGHSMGALVAHALTRLRQDRGTRLPERLLAGGAKAPHLPIALTAAHRLPDDELGELLVGFGGMSPTMLRYPDWLRAALELFRDDLSVCLTNPYQDVAPLPCPIDAFTGDADPLVSLDDAMAWGRHTAAGHRLHVVPGGHFFFKDSSAPFFHELAAAVGRPGLVGSGAAPRGGTDRTPSMPLRF